MGPSGEEGLREAIRPPAEPPPANRVEGGGGVSVSGIAAAVVILEDDGFSGWSTKWEEAGSVGRDLAGVWSGGREETTGGKGERALQLLVEAFQYGKEEAVTEKARAWAEGFQFPEEVRERDAADLKRLEYDVEALARERMEVLRPRMLNKQRIEATVGPVRSKLVLKEDYDRLVEIAENGMAMELESGFEPRGKPNALRMKYLATGGAVDKLLYKQYLNGTLLIVPTEDALKIKDVHYSDQSWAAKKESESGRVIGDLSFGENGFNINGTTQQGREEIRKKIVEKWTAIELPTLEMIMDKVLAARKRYGRVRLILYKCDVKGAFNLLLFAAWCVRLTAFALAAGLTVLHLVGQFGWTGTPHAWGVVMRILLTIASEAIGECFLEIFVDDFMGATDIDLVDSEMGKVTAAITGLLGPGAEAPQKNERGRRLDLIGWTVDLDTETVTMSRRNLLKALVAFYSVDEKRGVTLGQVEVAASLGIRYAAINRGMKVFTVSLFKEISRYNGNRTIRRHLSGQSRQDIIMWRAFLVMVGLDEPRYARSFDSFRAKEEASVVIEYDGSLKGLGIGVSRVTDGESNRELRGFVSVYPMPYATTSDSSFQNTQEFVAIVVGLLVCCREGWRAFTFGLIGDSVSTLSWAGHDRANSELARRASIAYSVICVRLDATAGRTRFVRGKDNSVMDDLSRGVMDRHVLSLDQSRRIEVKEGGAMHRFIELLNPFLPLETPKAHADLYKRLDGILDEIEREGNEMRNRRR